MGLAKFLISSPKRKTTLIFMTCIIIWHTHPSGCIRLLTAAVIVTVVENHTPARDILDLGVLRASLVAPRAVDQRSRPKKQPRRQEGLPKS